MIPGGFSGGDEPDGSAKFITAFFRAPAVTEAVRDLLQNRDGLMLGICNGFQALVKLGLVPFGDIRPMDESCPTLTFNTIGRHQSRLVHTRVASNLSPWLSPLRGGRHSHGAREPWRRPLRGVARTGGRAGSERPDRDTVCGRKRRAVHGPGREPERIGAGHRVHNQPRRPHPGQDGPQRAAWQRPVPRTCRATSSNLCSKAAWATSRTSPSAAGGAFGSPPPRFHLLLRSAFLSPRALCQLPAARTPAPAPSAIQLARCAPQREHPPRTFSQECAQPRERSLPASARDPARTLGGEH